MLFHHLIGTVYAEREWRPQSKGEDKQEREEVEGRVGRVSECVSKHEQAGASGCRGGDASCQQI